MLYDSKNMVLIFPSTARTHAEKIFLKHIIAQLNKPTFFCRAHELAGRNRITRNRFRIAKAGQKRTLPPFHFLINMN